MDAVDEKNSLGMPSTPGEPSLVPEKLEERIAALLTATTDEEESLDEVRAYLDDRHSILRAWPTLWPVRGWVTSLFGPREAPMPGASTWHEGLDISADYGEDVLAAADGVVAFAGWSNGYGQLVTVDHGFGFVTRYGHNSELLVQEGDRVVRGEVIAQVGSTGRSTGPHVHYEVHRHGVPVNPYRYLARDDGGTGTAPILP